MWGSGRFFLISWEPAGKFRADRELALPLPASFCTSLLTYFTQCDTTCCVEIFKTYKVGLSGGEENSVKPTSWPTFTTRYICIFLLQCCINLALFFVAAQVICLSLLEPVMPPWIFSFCCHYRTQHGKNSERLMKHKSRAASRARPRPSAQLAPEAEKRETEAEICVDLISVELWPLYSRERCCDVDGAAGQKEFNAGHAWRTQNRRLPPHTHTHLLPHPPSLQAVITCDACKCSTH